jgi:hypothetical protein
MDPIQAAIEAYESQEPGEQLSVQEVADNHGVWRSTMQRRMADQIVPRAEHTTNTRKLSPQQEDELVLYIESLTACCLPPTRAMIQNFAPKVAHERVSERWVSRFLIRHNNSLTPQWTDTMDRDRHQAGSGHRYKAFFEEIYDQMTRHDIQLEHSYNMDEKGFLLGNIGKSKRVFSKALWEQGGVKTNMQDGNREWITTVACTCADGSALPPVLLFASSNSTLQSTWVKDIKATKHSAHIGSTPTGWSNDEMGLDWLKNVFDRYTKTKARNSWRMLILDGHGSHLTAAFIAYCFENKILLIIYPPHATHTIQPLDVVMFRSLSSNYSKTLSTQVQDSQGLLPVKKMNFFLMFWTAWTASFTRDNILQALKSTGVWLMYREPILKKFHTPTTEDQEDPEFEQLEKVLDWKDLKRLYNSVVVDQSTKEAKILASSLHYLSTQFELISAENTGLRTSLQDKTKHKIRGQVLSHLTNNSASLTLSPSTVEKAL